MSSISPRIMSLVAAGLLCAGASRAATAQAATPVSTDSTNTVIYRASTPLAAPALKPDLKAGAHSPNAVWVPGFWNFEGDAMTAPDAGWVWVPGQWEEPPVHGAEWDAAHGGFAGEWWSWIPGHWDEPRRAR